MQVLSGGVELATRVGSPPRDREISRKAFTPQDPPFQVLAPPSLPHFQMFAREVVTSPNFRSWLDCAMCSTRLCSLEQ